VDSADLLRQARAIKQALLIIREQRAELIETARRTCGESAALIETGKELLFGLDKQRRR
jgi:hypothetical protein